MEAKNEEIVELGPIQKEWLRSLEEHPERRMTGELGLMSGDGNLKQPARFKGNYYRNLAEMNDGGMTWPEIASRIRENPNNVFTKAV